MVLRLHLPLQQVRQEATESVNKQMKSNQATCGQSYTMFRLELKIFLKFD
jgi:hypothetical protein